MGSKGSEGIALVKEGESKLNQSSGWLSSLFGSGSSSQQEQAAELFTRAGTCFKLAKDFKAAGDAYERAASAYEQAGSSFDAASKYYDAAKAYKNAAPNAAAVKKAADCYKAASRLHSEDGRLQQAAKLYKELAELYEASSNSGAESGTAAELAMEYFEKAADLYEAEDATTHASSCRVKVAEMAALHEDYSKAAALFEGAAENAVSNKLLKYGAKEHLLRAGICRLCLGDDVGTSRAFDRYASLDNGFPDSREGGFLTGLLHAKEEGDVEAFTKAAYDFDSVLKLDPWKTTMLLRIKNGIRAVEDDLT
mmetsp:Transcript_7673/g.13911  ORF Transcript_7673/g.13911 Transcript_7673/m.13911 type:complete len:309 (-) Transcript_7673:182-1108(-)